MKKLIVILLAAAACLSLFACGENEPAETPTPSAEPADAGSSDAPDTPAEEPAAEPAPEPEPEPEPAPEPEPEPEPAPAEASTGFEGTEIPADGVIRTAAELGKVLTDGDMAGTYKVDAAELDMDGIRYGSLGRDDAPFTGIFDFGGCTLKNLYQPLFFYTSGAEISNLKIADTKIENDDEIPEGMIRFGLVVSDATDTKISDIEVADSVELSVNIYTTDGCIGGIVGHAGGDCEFARFSSAAKVTTDSAVKILVSPLIAWFEGRSTSTSSVEDCVFTGTLEDLSGGNDSKVAGILGAAGNVTVSRCANYGKIVSNDGGQCAGVLGWACGEGSFLENCLNAGSVEGGTYTGGIIGYSNRANGELTLCLNVGEVVGAAADSCGAVGGLIKNTETWSFGFWTEDSSAVGFNNIGSASITDFEACANAEAAVNAINGAGGNFKIDGGRVVIGD
ncbi:MAG: hypothetical protein IIU08_08290 [Clostridia bacterium]|nr:hypothetical protein [Clostridia bacterium]